jgi:hypothetical protein
MRAETCKIALQIVPVQKQEHATKDQFVIVWYQRIADAEGIEYRSIFLRIRSACRKRHTPIPFPKTTILKFLG